MLETIAFWLVIAFIFSAIPITVAKDLAGNQLGQDPSLDGPQQMKWFFTIRR